MIRVEIDGCIHAGRRRAAGQGWKGRSSEASSVVHACMSSVLTHAAVLGIPWWPHSSCRPVPPQRKTDGVKAVVTLTSLAAQLGGTSESARALDKPTTAFDKLQLAYKVSKAALNQGALTLPTTLARLAVLTTALAGWTPRRSTRCQIRKRSNMQWQASRRCSCSTSTKHRDAESTASLSLPAVTVQLGNELKGEGFTFIAMHPGATLPCEEVLHVLASDLRRVPSQK